MPLADDLMEPFRPIVDLAASRLFAAGERDVTPSVKRSLAAILQQEQPTVAGRTPLSTCMVRLAASLAESFLSGHARLDLPRLALSAGEGEDEAGS
jgi:CRISPR-associated protein Cas1